MMRLIPTPQPAAVFRQTFSRTFLWIALLAAPWGSGAPASSGIGRALAAEPARPMSEDAGATVLRFGETFNREIASGQPHKWRMTLAAGQYVQIGFSTQDVSLTGNLSDPDGAAAAAVPLWHATVGSRYAGVISFIAEKSGVFTLALSVEGKMTDADAGRYEMRAEAPRPAVEEDRRRIGAHRIWTAAMKLREPQTAEGRRAALAQYEEALGIFMQINDAAGQAMTLNTIGGIWYDLANAQKVFEAQDKALKLWQSLDRPREEGVTMSELGLIAYVRYDYPKTMEWYRAALAKHRAAEDVFYEAETMNRIGWCENARGDARQALVSYKQALELRRAAGDRNGESVTLNDIGRALDDLGEPAQALEAFQHALRLCPPERNPRGASNILNRMGMAHKRLGDWQKALDAYRRTLTLARQAGDRRSEAAALNNLGALLCTLGEPAAGLEQYEQALRLNRELKLRNGEAATLHAMGVMHTEAGEHRKSLEMFLQSLAIRRTIQDAAGEAAALASLARVYNWLGDHQKGLEAAQQSLQKYQALGRVLGETVALESLANAHAALGEKAKALEHYQRALVLERKIRNRLSEANTLLRLGLFHRQAGELGEARVRVAEAIAIMESFRDQAISPEVRTLFHPSFSDRYLIYIDLLMASERETPGAGFAAQGFQASERARARNLLDLLAESRADIRAGVDPKLLATERELQQRRNVKAEIQVALLGGKHTPEQAAALANELAGITAELNDVDAKIRAASPRYASLTKPVPLTAAEIQQRVLDDDTLLLEYALGKQRSYLWAVTTREIHSFVLPGSGEIETAARRWLDLLPKGAQRKYQRETELAAADLSRLILAPAAAHLRKKRLVIVADGVLQYAPFAALPKPVVGAQQSASNRQLLIKEHELVSLPSASALAVLRNEIQGRPAAAKQLAVFADPVFQTGDARVQLAKTISPGAPVAVPESAKDLAGASLTRAATEAGITSFTRLPFARQEAEAIASLLPREQQLKALDFSASRETALTGGLDQYRHIHFATHGLLNSRHPELSGIVLSLVDEAGQPRDGFLRLSDLYNLKLNADLVVLSACQTALGKDVRGEGLVGLTRGFMFAGAARVVASLWNVNDAATADLMRKFYRAMAVERQTPAAALRTAQLAMSRDARWSAPYYWSGFVLQGEWK